MLPGEKKQRILNAALREFSAQAFKNASTARIAEEAGISKGALFLYFSTKRQLYQYLYEYAYNVVRNEFTGKLDFESRDPIYVLTAVTRVKMDIMRVHPELFDFFVKIYLGETDEELRGMIHRDSESERGRFIGELLSDLDYSGFRGDFPPEIVMDIIRWVIDGYTNRLTASLKAENASFAEAAVLTDEYYRYLDVIRKAFYQ